MLIRCSAFPGTSAPRGPRTTSVVSDQMSSLRTLFPPLAVRVITQTLFVSEHAAGSVGRHMFCGSTHVLWVDTGSVGRHRFCGSLLHLTVQSAPTQTHWIFRNGESDSVKRWYCHIQRDLSSNKLIIHQSAVKQT